LAIEKPALSNINFSIVQQPVHRVTWLLW